jgi:hypothetical protein
MRHRPHLIAACATIAALVAAAPGLAQTQTEATQPTRPFQGLFGGNEADLRARQTLNFNFSLMASYDDNSVTAFSPETAAELDPLLTYTGLYYGGAPSLDYRRNWRHGTFAAAGGTSVRYYPKQKEVTRVRDWGTVAFSRALGPRTTINASQGVSYSSYFMNGYFPSMTPVVAGEPVVPGYDNYTYRRPNYQFNTAADFEHRFTQKASASAYYSLTYIDFLKTDLYPTARYYAQQISARYQQSLARSLAFRVGYSYLRYRHGLIFIPDVRTRGDNVELGLDYQKTLRIAGRKTTLGFSAGSAMVTYLSKRYFTYLIHSYASSALGPKWVGVISYDRNFSFVEGLAAPYATDAVTANVGGYLNRRTNLTFGGGYTHGTGVATSSGRSYGAWTGVGQLQVAVAREIALYGYGYFYHFDFKGEYPYSPLPARQWDRWGVRCGVTFWVPLLR